MPGEATGQPCLYIDIGHWYWRLKHQDSTGFESRAPGSRIDKSDRPLALALNGLNGDYCTTGRSGWNL